MILTYVDIFVGVGVLIVFKMLSVLIHQQWFAYQSYCRYDLKPRPLPVARIKRDPWRWSDLLGPVPVFSFLLIAALVFTFWDVVTFVSR